MGPKPGSGMLVKGFWMGEVRVAGWSAGRKSRSPNGKSVVESILSANQFFVVY